MKTGESVRNDGAHAVGERGWVRRRGRRRYAGYGVRNDGAHAVGIWWMEEGEVGRLWKMAWRRNAIYSC